MKPKHIIKVIALMLILAALRPQMAGMTPATSATTQVTHGAHLRPVAQVYGQEILDFNALAGKDIGLLMYFVPWSPFDAYLPDLIQQQIPSNRQPVLMLTWEPGGNSSGCNLGYGDNTGPLRSIISGRCDAYIRSFAQALDARPERFLLRLAHEMNTGDYPWGHAYFNHGSDAPSYYVAMFRHVHQIFREAGVDNVEWVWSPNYGSNPPPELPGSEWNSLHAYYPGDAYVDWIGLSGYNWGGSGGNALWMTFDEIYGSVLQELACHYAKPQILAEIGTVDGSGSPQTKAEWLIDAYQSVPNYPFVRSIIWFNDFAYENPAAADFRVTTSRAHYGDVVALPVSTGEWTQAYRDGLADDIYVDTLAALDAVTPPQTYCGEAPSVSVTPSRSLAMPGNTVYYHARGFGYTETLPISVNVPPGVGLTASVSPNSLEPLWGKATIAVQTGGNTPVGTHNLTIHVGPDVFPVELRVFSFLYRVHLPIVNREQYAP